jgi:hypothetical protein
MVGLDRNVSVAGNALSRMPVAYAPLDRSTRRICRVEFNEQGIFRHYPELDG